MNTGWSVYFSTKAVKQYEKLKSNGVAMEIQLEGPERFNWPNYGKISGNYHCHLKKGKPTYVACWAILDDKLKRVEIYYVGTHENAPY